MIDDEIIEKAINRDKYAFRAIFNAYRQKVYRTSYLLLKEHQRAEDAVQETFLQIHLNIHKLASSKAFSSWIYKITVNTCYSFIRKSKKFETLPIEDNIDECIQDEAADLQVPDNIILRKELQSCIMECIYSLPLKHRTVLTLFYFNNLSIKEIADIADCSEGTVKSRLFYGKKVLKEKLMNHGELINIPLGGVVCES